MSRRFGGARMGGGGSGQSEDYGPTAGRASVIAGAAPRAVSDPGGGITFTSAADLQTKIDANPANTIFVPSASWSDWSQRVVPNGKHPRIFVPGAPGSRIFDAGGRDLVAFIGGSNGSQHFELYGGSWRNVGTAYPPTGGQGNGFSADAGSTIRDIEVSDCMGAGVSVFGSGTEVGYFRAYDNAQDGVRGSLTNTWVHHGKFDGNGYRDPDAVPDHGGSGKWSGGTGGIMEFCYASEVWDYGPWDDNGGHMIIRECVFEDCRKTAPFFEIMEQGGEISRCWLARNGEAATGGEYFFANVMTIASCETMLGAQILVQRNHIEGAERLIAMNNQVGRGNTKRVNILDNRIKFTSTAARLGGEDGNAVDVLFTEPTIVFDRNKYIAPNTTGTYFHWGTPTTDKTFAQWQALGYDPNSTIEVG